MADWKPIKDAPLDKMIMVANAITGDVFMAYGYWGKAPFPYWNGVDDTGVGRCKPTHWSELPAPPPKSEQQTNG